MTTRKGLHHASCRGRQNLCMNQPTSSAAALASRLRLRAQLMGHMVERARINPAAPTAGIKTMEVAAQMLCVIKELGAGKR